MPINPLAGFAVALFCGGCAHIKAAQYADYKDEGMLWLWTTTPQTRTERWARYSFFAWVTACFVLFLPINLKVAFGIFGAFLTLHLLIVIARNW